MVPSTKHSLLSDTHSHTDTLTRAQSPPMALSLHLFMQNVSMMKCTVIYVSSDSTGPENEVLISCMDL